MQSFFVTTTAAKDDNSEGNPGNSNVVDAVDVAPPVPAPDVAPPVPAPDVAPPVPAPDEAASEPAAAEPAPRGPVVQELYLTLDNPTDRALFQLGT